MQHILSFFPHFRLLITLQFFSVVDSEASTKQELGLELNHNQKKETKLFAAELKLSWNVFFRAVEQTGTEYNAISGSPNN